jgi:CubicO group peptidase (beta-lactamase class C family)
VHGAATAFFADQCHVGMSLAVYDRGKVRFYNYGTVSKSNRRLPSRRTLYEIGSVTKTFTGVVASKAILDGKMTLDSDFRAYLEGSYPNLAKEGVSLTLRSLVAHTSGLPRDMPDNSELFVEPDFETLPFKLVQREKDYDDARYLEELHGVTLASEPGKQFSYSNLGTKVVAFGLQKVYGAPYSQLVHDFVTRPLRMRRTVLSVPPAQRHMLAEPYGVSGKPVPYHLPNAGAAGGLYSTTEDMIRYAAWHLDETIPLVRRRHELIAGSSEEFGRAMNWYVARHDNGERKIWQSGGVFGMSSQLILFPDSSAAYVLLANDGCFNTQSELEKIAFAVHASARR